MRKLVALALAVGAAVLVVSQAVPAQVVKGKKVVASATGAGHVTQTNAKRTFAFTAREHANGTDRGQAHLRDRATDPNLRVHVRVTCLNVVGDVAHMTGVVTRVKTATPPLLVRNARVAFSVEDNGQTGDRISPMTFHGTGPQLDCETPSTAPTLVVQRGQVKVRP
jgi:hypothetical protein